MPLPIHAWQDALRNVDTNLANLDPSNRSNPHDGKYAFPEPGIFASVTSDLRRDRYFHTWKSTKSVLLYRIFSASSTAVPLSGQEWRDFLIGNFNGAFLGAKNLDAQQRFRSLFASCLDELSLDFENFLPLTTSPPSTTPEEGQKVLWELSELNFRSELSALDRRASGSTSNTEIQDRQDMICKCFTNNSLVPELQHATQGLASVDWTDRLPILLRLRALMRDWTGHKSLPLLAPDLQTLDSYSEADVRALEDAAACFYTQTFYNFFGRAAIIPTRLPPK